MLSFATLRALLSRVPSIAWVVLFTFSFLSAAAGGIYLVGRRAGRVEVHKIALRDSVLRVTGAVAIATKKSDSAVVRASETRAAAARTRPTVRAAIVAELADRPAVQSLVTEQLDADSLTIAVQAATIDTLLAERVLRISRDTLVTHELELGTDAGDGTAVKATKVVVVVVALVGVARFALQHLKRSQ